MSITKMRSALGVGMAALMAAMVGEGIPSKLMRARGILDTQGRERARKAAPRRPPKLNKPKSSSFGRHKGMLWVGGKWLFFRP